MLEVHHSSPVIGLVFNKATSGARRQVAQVVRGVHRQVKTVSSLSVYAPGNVKRPYAFWVWYKS